MNKNNTNILTIFTSRLKKIGINLLKNLLYMMMCSRLFILKIKHLVFNKSKRLPRKILLASREINYSKYYKSLFVWDLRDSTTYTRINIVFIGFAIVFLAISVRLIVVASSDYVNYRESNKRSTTKRYDIVDRYNNLLAVNLPGASLYANPRRIIDPDQSVDK
jgi:hypothetical protein